MNHWTSWSPSLTKKNVRMMARMSPVTPSATSAAPDSTPETTPEPPPDDTASPRLVTSCSTWARS